MEKFLFFLIKPLVSDSAQLQISIQDNSLVVTVPQSDMGKVIGKQGQAVYHLRNLVQTYCKLHRLPPKYLQIKEQPPV